MKTFRYKLDDYSSVVARGGADYYDAYDTVKEILSTVKEKGDIAVIEYTKKYDKVDVNLKPMSNEKINQCCDNVEEKVKHAILTSYQNIKKVHTVQNNNIKKEWLEPVCDGVRVGERITPIASVGCYIPGGLASYPSTVLMCCIPAKIAGVERIVVVSPPPIDDAVVFAAQIVGVNEIIEVGGAQAIAALAYGTESIKSVNKIVGPGNKYVTSAKTQVYGICDVDMPAGPSEILILADEHADSDFIAADILAQAEHDPNAQCVLATTSEKIAALVETKIKESIIDNKRAKILGQSIENISIIQCEKKDELIDFANEYAAEHLELHLRELENILPKIKNAGAIFAGIYSAVAFGDYASGGNHVLPTSGAAKYASQLSVRDFLKSSSLQWITKEGICHLHDSVVDFAEHEGLFMHAESVRVRCKKIRLKGCEK